MCQLMGHAMKVTAKYGNDCVLYLADDSMFLVFLFGVMAIFV